MLAMSCALCTGLQLVLNLDLLNTAVFQKLPNYASTVLDCATKGGDDVHSVFKLSVGLVQYFLSIFGNRSQSHLFLCIIWDFYGCPV